jgi:hypothetical protein
MFLWQMGFGTIHVRFINDYDDDGNESDFGDDDSEHGDIDNGDEKKHKFLKDDKKGFIFSDVQLSDDGTYKCEAKNQNQLEVSYFYMHVGK